MKRVSYGRRADRGTDVELLWFSDRWNEARKLDSESTIWLEISESDALNAWRRVRDTVLREWILAHPGTRPYWWWEFDAPRATAGTFLNSRGFDIDPRRQLAEPRRRLEGSNKPGWEVVAIAARLAYGLPGCPYDNENDPPPYESETEYLRRHNLLFPGELERRDFTPEVHRHRETPLQPVE